MTIIEAIDQGLVTRIDTETELHQQVIKLRKRTDELESMGEGFKRDMFATTKVAPINLRIDYLKTCLDLLTASGK